MTTFDTPDPIAVDLEVGVGEVRVDASDRTETTVEVNFLSGAYNMLPNDVMGDHMMTILEELGPIEFSQEEHAYARAIVESFPRELRLSVLEQDKLPAELLTFFSFQVAVMADQHDAVARGDAQHCHKSDQRTQRKYPAGQQRGRDSADERERQAEEDQSHQPWRAKIGMQQKQDA